MPSAVETANHGSLNSGTLTGAPSNCDFVTAYLAPNQIQLSGFPTGLTDFSRENIAMITVFSDSTVRSITYEGDYLNVQVLGGDVLQIDNLLYEFKSTDTFVVYTNIPREGVSVNVTQSDVQRVDESPDRVVTYTYAGVAGNYRVSTKNVASASLGLSYTDTYAYADAGLDDERVTSITRS